jgi:hypothetical protein
LSTSSAIVKGNGGVGALIPFSKELKPFRYAHVIWCTFRFIKVVFSNCVWQFGKDFFIEILKYQENSRA